MLNHTPDSLVNRLGPDILSLIISYLDPYALASFSKTCRLFRDTVRRELSFETALWQHHQPNSEAATVNRFDSHTSSTDPPSSSSWHPHVPHLTTKPPQLGVPPPPVFHMRCLAKIGQQLYMPFMASKPVCYVYNIEDNAWARYPLQPPMDYTPFVAPVAAVGTRLYMFGGRKIASGTLSDEVHVIDTETWSLEHLQLMRGPLPTPRCEHTVDVLENRYLLVFGGVCSNSLSENDLAIFDTRTLTWTEPAMTGQIPTVRYGHASAMNGHNLYIFGGCEIRAEGYFVHDSLYRLDCSNWTWHKYDYPEAYSYRHRRDDGVVDGPPGQQAALDTLRRDSIVETTGHPPRDRFHCVLQPVGRHKLLIFGGHTVRQDSEDRNVLHAHSLQSIDVFDLKRNHWSAIMTSCTFDDGGETNVYPQDISAFPIQGSNRFLVIGQQKIFSSHTESSSGEHSDYFGSSPPLAHHLQSSQAEEGSQQQQQLGVNQPAPRTSSLSRPIADYEGFLDLIITSEDDTDSYHESLSIDDMFRSMPSIAGGLLSGPVLDEKQCLVNRHYTLELLCTVLALNQT